MGRNVKDTANEVVMGSRKGFKNNGKRQPGITPLTFWEQGFPSFPTANDIDEILKYPETDDMAGILARGCFKNEKQRIAAVRLAYRHRVFNDEAHQKMLRDFIASGLGMQALGKILQIQSGTNLMVPGVLREILGMKKSKGSEDIYRGSDFRERPPQSGQQGGNE